MELEPTWPPPPAVPDPLAEYDAFFTSLFRAPAKKQPLSRLSLIRHLRKETGLDLRQCMAVVNSYCDRNAILLPTRGMSAWIGCFLPIAMLSTIATMQVAWFFLERAHDAAPTRLARRAITAERIHLDFVFLGIILICGVIQLCFVIGYAKKARRDAADARTKMGGGEIK